jgi:serine/threonine-protein kinase RsbW
MSRVDLRIPSKPEFVAVARLTVSAIASRMAFGFDAIDDIKVAVGEACTNAIVHACCGGEEEILIRCSLHPEQLVIEVHDKGPGLPPEEQWTEDVHLGLVLIRALMDEVKLESTPQSGTCVRMVKYRQRA